MRWGAGEGISTQAYRSIAENVNKRKSGGSDAGSGVGGRRYEYDGGGGGQPWRRGAGHTGWQTSGIELDAECGGGSMHFAEMAASLGAPDAAANKRHRTEQLVSGLESLQLKTDPQTPLWLCPVYKVREQSLVDNCLSWACGTRTPRRAIGSGLHAHHDGNPFQQTRMLRASVTCSGEDLWEAGGGGVDELRGGALSAAGVVRSLRRGHHHVALDYHAHEPQLHDRPGPRQVRATLSSVDSDSCLGCTRSSSHQPT